MSDLGIVGLLTFLGLLATGLFVAARDGLRSPPAVAVTALVSMMWLVLVMGVLSALGLVAGIPSDATALARARLRGRRCRRKGARPCSGLAPAGRGLAR